MRRSVRAARRPGPAAPESLESRDLLAYTPLGFSLPDLSVSGFSAPVAAWGNPLAVTVDVRNTGASTLVEPLSLTPGSTSSADAPASTVAVFALKRQHSFRGAVQVGTVNVPAIPQNDNVQVTQTITLPIRPSGFPGDGGKVYLLFIVNAGAEVFESDPTNNVSRPVPVTIEAPLPELSVVGFDVPPVIQPGDTIQPNIRVANFGPAATAAQGTFVVDVVASTTPNFNSGSTVVASYTVANVPPKSLSPSKTPQYGDVNLVPPANIVTIAGSPVTLPTTPGRYYIGVVIDPTLQIKQIQNVPTFVRPRNPFSLPHVVGPPIKGLPPAGVVTPGGVGNIPVFPFPFGLLPVGGSLDGLTFPAPFPPTAAVLTTGAGNTGGAGGTRGAPGTGPTSGGNGGGVVLNSLAAGVVAGGDQLGHSRAATALASVPIGLGLGRANSVAPRATDSTGTDRPAQ